MELQAELQRQLALLGLSVPTPALTRLLWLQAELLRWNRTHNLTAITDPREALEKHLVDSLTLLPHLPARGRLLDLGSGGGFPGLPLAIVRPELELVSVDAVAKKIAFQRHAARRLGLDGFTAWHGRAEKLATAAVAAGGFDLVVARAFTSLTGLLELALPCLRSAGKVIAMKGPEGESELGAAAEWLAAHDLVCVRRQVLQLPASGARRLLLVFVHKHKM